MEKKSKTLRSGLSLGAVDADSFKVERYRPSLRDQVLKVLRQAILDLRFVPGERLIERELCDLIGVSRTSIREALRHLESEGLVTNLPNVGPVVASVSVEEAQCIYEFREVLEVLAGRLFIERATEQQLAAVRKALASLSKALKSGDMRSIVRETTQFYDVFLEGCGNPFVSSTIRSLQARLVLIRALSMSNPDRAPESLKEMKAIVSALEQRDVGAATEAFLTHIRRAREAAMPTLNMGTSSSEK